MPKPKFDPSQPFSAADKPKFNPNAESTPVPDTKVNPFQTANVQEDTQSKLPPGIASFLHAKPGERAGYDAAIARSNNPKAMEKNNDFNPLDYASPVSGAGAAISGIAGAAGKGLGSVAGLIPGVSKVATLAKLIGKLAEGVAPEAEVATKAATEEGGLASALKEGKSTFDPFTKMRSGPASEAPVKPKIDPFNKIVQKRSDLTSGGSNE